MEKPTELPEGPACQHPFRSNRWPAHPAAGFTLAEVLISATVSVMLLAAILSAFFHLTKTGMALGNYHDLEMESQQALYVLFRDVLQAEEAAWDDRKTLRLTVEGVVITYAFDEQQRQLTRNQPGNGESVLASGVRGLTFRAYDVTGNELSLNSNPASAGPSTKMVQIRMELDRKVGSSTNAAAITSARYMLRNKPSF